MRKSPEQIRSEMSKTASSSSHTVNPPCIHTQCSRVPNASQGTLGTAAVRQLLQVMKMEVAEMAVGEAQTAMLEVEVQWAVEEAGIDEGMAVVVQRVVGA